MEHSKEDRLEVFLQRLALAPVSSTFESAYKLVCDTLNSVEDEMTTIPFASENWETDGRMYPPQMDNLREVTGYQNVRRFRSRGHNLYIAENGAIEIRDVRNEVVVFHKDGENGRGLWST